MAIKEDLSALSDVLNMDIDETEFEFSDLLNTTEELVFDDNDVSQSKKKEVVINKSPENKIVQEDLRDYSLITEKHWLIDKVYLQNILDTLSGVIIKSGDLISKSICLYYKENSLYLNFNSNEVQGSFEIPLENKLKESIYDTLDYFVLDYSKFVVAVKNSDSKVILKEKIGTKTLLVELLGGEVELDNYSGINFLNYSKVMDVDFSFLNKVEIGYSGFVDFLKHVSATDKLSFRVEERKVRVQNKEAFSNYSLSVVHYKNVDIEDVSLRLLDVQLLLKFLSYNKNTSIFKYTDLKNNYFIIGNCRLSFPKVNTEDLKYIQRVCGSLNIKSEFTMEVIPFYKKLNLLRQLTGNGNTLHLFKSGDELIISSLNSNQRETKFPVAKGLTDDVFLDVKLPIMLIMNTFKMFKDYGTIKVKVTDQQRPVFEVDGFSLILGNLT